MNQGIFQWRLIKWCYGVSLHVRVFFKRWSRNTAKQESFYMRPFCMIPVSVLKYASQMFVKFTLSYYEVNFHSPIGLHYLPPDKSFGMGKTGVTHWILHRSVQFYIDLYNSDAILNVFGQQSWE